MTSPFEKPRTNSGLYIYAITNVVGDRIYDVKDIDGCAVYRISEGLVAAVVSDCARQRIRPERAHLAAHKDVLKHLMTDGTVLPMSFGIVADHVKAVQRLLARNEKDFLRQFERVGGKMEMGLRVVWDVPNIFEYFVDTHPDLRASRDRLMGNNREPSQEEKIELGQLFDQTLGEERDIQNQKLEEALSDSCFEIKRSLPRGMNEVANMSFLIGRNRQKDFESAVFQAANLFDNNFSFDMNGPWAPHNFVEMNLKPDGR
jgi:hypothetical protein